MINIFKKFSQYFDKNYIFNKFIFYNYKNLKIIINLGKNFNFIITVQNINKKKNIKK